MSTAVTRRQVLQGAAAAVAGTIGLRRAPVTQPAHDCDVCIVGSGFAGTYLGLRLAGRGLRTTIVEAGPRLSRTDPDDGASSLLPCVSEGDLGFPVDETRTIAVGGTSRRWNGVIARLSPDDLRLRTRFGLDVDWPIDYTDLDEWYCEAERLLDVARGPFIAAAEPPRCAYPAEATDYRSPAALFAGHDLAFHPLAFALGPDRRPLRLDDGPLSTFTSAPGARLLPDHPVTSLLVEDRARVIGVRTQPAGSGAVDIRARHVVLAAGPIETARLLLTSAIASGVVPLGAHFNAHPRYRTRVVTPRRGLDRPAGIHRTISPAAAARRAGTGAFHLDAHTALAQPDLDVMLELEPAAANRLHLDPTRPDRWGRPGLVLRARWTPRDLRTRERALALLRTLAGRLGDVDPVLPAERWFHPAGVCRMAAAPDRGVVSPDGDVFGMVGLSVSGAAVFPTSGSTNPTLTIVALALRLGDHLARRLTDGGRRA